MIPQKPHHGTQKLVNLGSFLKDDKKKLSIEILEDEADDVDLDVQQHKRASRALKPTQQESSGSQRKTVHKVHDAVIREGAPKDLNKKFTESMNMSKDMFESTNGENIQVQQEIDQFEEGKSIDMDLDIPLVK